MKKNLTPILAAAFLSASLLVTSCGGSTDNATEGMEEDGTTTEMGAEEMNDAGTATEMDTAGMGTDTTGTTTGTTTM